MKFTTEIVTGECPECSEQTMLVSNSALVLIHLNSVCEEAVRLARRLPFKHSDIDGCIRASLISPLIIISKATTNSVILFYLC